MVGGYHVDHTYARSLPHTSLSEGQRSYWICVQPNAVSLFSLNIAMWVFEWNFLPSHPSNIQQENPSQVWGQNVGNSIRMGTFPPKRSSGKISAVGFYSASLFFSLLYLLEKVLWRSQCINP